MIGHLKQLKNQDLTISTSYATHKHNKSSAGCYGGFAEAFIGLLLAGGCNNVVALEEDPTSCSLLLSPTP